MEVILNFLEGLTVETIVTYIADIGMILTAITSVFLALKSAAKTNENINVQSQVDKALIEFKAQMLKKMQDMNTETMVSVKDTSDKMLKAVLDKQELEQAKRQAEIDNATIKVTEDLKELEELTKEA